MGFSVTNKKMDIILKQWSTDYKLFAPKRYIGGATFSDVDCIRYGEIQSISEVEFIEKSQYSFKEALMPISQTLFYFTQDSVKEAEAPKKGILLFLRSCDIHALKRLDEIYLSNGAADYYYQQLRKNIKIVLMGCPASYENCFCVSMQTNQTEEYDLSIDLHENLYYINCKNEHWETIFKENAETEIEVKPIFVKENDLKVNIPKNLSAEVAKSSIWEEYDSRCISCGRCNFVCPTCTCFSMQDMFYTENGKAGERRRVWASCMVDGFTDVAGGGSYRQKNGQRMRFKVLHKVLDFYERNGYHMCVGCGRCDDVCSEYISFSNCINKLEKAMGEVSL